MERWIVISNCQTFGLANSLQVQADDIEVVGVDTYLFNSDPDRYNEELSQSSLLICANGVESYMPRADFTRAAARRVVPTISIRAYHPDLVYLSHNDKLVDGPSSDYHSAIVFAAFTKGMTVHDTQLLFNGKFYERCGYFDLWLHERDRQIQDFKEYGLDISIPIRRWGRNQAFMYSINHPRIVCLYDIATEILRLTGRSPKIGDLIPSDNLAIGAYFPVYPEIAENLGVKGNYRFKPIGTYRSIGLSEYISNCFSVYERLPKGEIRAINDWSGFGETIKRVSYLI